MIIDRQLKDDLKKYLQDKIKQDRQKTVIISSYPLNPDEVHSIIKAFPSLKITKVKNVVDRDIIAGIIIKFGSKIIDLSLSSQLKNFKKLMYEAH